MPGLPLPQVWKDALASKAAAPYMNHTLHGGTLSALRYCPYEVRAALCCVELCVVPPGLGAVLSMAAAPP